LRYNIDERVAHSHVRYSEFAGTDAGFSLALDLYRNECIAMACRTNTYSTTQAKQIRSNMAIIMRE